MGLPIGVSAHCLAGGCLSALDLIAVAAICSAEISVVVFAVAAVSAALRAISKRAKEAD